MTRNKRKTSNETKNEKQEKESKDRRGENR